jgi:GTP pyrophosphokinase
MAQTESVELGEKLLSQSLRAEGIDKLPSEEETDQIIWEKLLRFTGNRNRADLLMDIGLGKRIATIVAKRLTALLAERGQKPDALLMTRERFTAHESISQGAITLDGSEKTSSVTSAVVKAWPCTPATAPPPENWSTRTANASSEWSGQTN